MSGRSEFSTGKYSIPVPWLVWPALSYASTYELPSMRGLMQYRRLTLGWLRFYASFTWAIRKEGA